MATLAEITEYLDATLNLAAVPGDKSNNGLQVAGGDEVQTVVGGVDGCLALYQGAAAAGADLVLVHHGESWGPGHRYFTGGIGARLALLFRAEMSLYAVHLPLDAHPTLGHNAQIADRLGLRHRLPFAEYAGVPVGIIGELPEPMGAEELAARVNDALDTDCLVLDFADARIDRVGIVSGSGTSALAESQRLGCQALITGDVGHTDYHVIQELGGCLLAAGHYKTEAPGILAVLDLLEQEFGVETEFIDLPTGM
jgi:dinuclear metal center YbgI/SA1388 family protein